MVPSLIALALSGGIVLAAVPGGRARAFRSGWFERSGQTRRRRQQRRPTHGGLVLAVALAAGALVAGADQPAARATVVAAVLAVATGWRAERNRGPTWAVRGGRVTAAGALPLMGVRAHLTGGPATDALLTAAVALVLMAGFRSIERSDGTGPAVAAVSAIGLLAVALRIDDPVAPVAAAAFGGGAAMAANTWPPAVVRIGVIGPTVLGASLAAVAIGLQPALAAPRTMLVPGLALLVVGASAVVQGWDRRLDRRGLRARVALPTAAVAGAVAADGLARGGITLPLALVLAGFPVVLLAVLGIGARRSPSEGSPPRRNMMVATGAVAVVLLVGVGAVAGLVLVGARRSLEQGRELATAGLDAARDGDLGEAQALFEQANVAFADGANALDHPAVRVGEVLPVIGVNLRSAGALATVGQDLSSTAVAVAERSGADDLLVVDGRFPVEGARAVSGELEAALATLRRSTARLDAAESPLLLSQVRRGSAEVGTRVADATESIEVAAEATRIAPALLGADGDRRWMVAILTPSEQRGAGGLAGDFAELRASGGKVELVRSISAGEMNRASDPSKQLAALPAVYREQYSGFRPGRFWQNLSASPDVPTMSQAVSAAFPLTTGGGPVDGVVTLDPFGIAALLELTGPVRVPGWPVPLGSDNAAEVLLFTHYDVLTEEQIDTFQGEVVAATVDALTSGTLPAPSKIAATLTPAVQGGHLRLWSGEAEAQALFRRVGADGSVEAPSHGTDFVQIVTQSASESKIDWFLRRRLTYSPVVNPTTGALRATATVSLTNTAPTAGVSSYVIGEPTGPTAVGENESRVTVLSPHRPIGAADGSGRPVAMNIGRDRGLYAVTALVEIPSGQSVTLTFTFEGSLAPTNGSYRLRVGRQPGVTPDQVQVLLEGTGGWVPVGAADARAELLGETDTGFSARLERR